MTREQQPFEQLLAGTVGDQEWPRAGVTQVVATYREGSSIHVLKINEHSPKSELDFLLLTTCRAWSDVILTSGRNLRSEPDLSYDLALVGSRATEIEQWRCRWGMTQPPDVAYLTSGRDLPLTHSALDGKRRSLLITSSEGASRLEPLLAEVEARRIEAVALDEPGPRQALGWLRAAGYRRILVELGPSTATQLHRSPRWIDHLVLSTFLGPINPSVAGEALLESRELERHFRRLGGSSAEQQSGLWRFERFSSLERELGLTPPDGREPV